MVSSNAAVAGDAVKASVRRRRGRRELEVGLGTRILGGFLVGVRVGVVQMQPIVARSGSI